MPIAAMTGRTSAYGAHERRRRRRSGRDLAPAATAASPGTTTSASRFMLLRVQGVRDVVARRRGSLLDGELAGQDCSQHRAEDIPVLDVDPVLRGGDEPAAQGGPLVHLRGVQE